MPPAEQSSSWRDLSGLGVAGLGLVATAAVRVTIPVVWCDESREGCPMVVLAVVAWLGVGVLASVAYATRHAVPLVHGAAAAGALVSLAVALPAGVAGVTGSGEDLRAAVQQRYGDRVSYDRAAGWWVVDVVPRECRIVDRDAKPGPRLVCLNVDLDPAS